MATIRRNWRKYRRGGVVQVNNTTGEIEIGNPWVGRQVNDFLNDANEEMDCGWYALSYLIEEYGDEAIEVTAEWEREKAEEFVGEIEERLYQQTWGDGGDT
jgi:hypothetical protein